jgi:PAS domain S-box-containing protein
MDTSRPNSSQTTGSFKAFTYLSLFGLAITIPLLLLFGALLVQSASVQRTQLEARVLQVLDALVNDLDRDLDRDTTILHTLATSQALASADWRTFYDQANAGLQGRAYLVLVDSNGRQLVNTYVPYGKQPALTGDPETVRRMLQTKAPVVSNLFTSLVAKKPVFNVSIPILQEGQVRYVMSLGLLPDDVLALLKSQKLASEWVTLIWDANGVLLARSRDNSRYVGTPLPRNMRGYDKRGVVRTTNLDGADVLHATAHSHLSDWGVGVNIPYSLVTAQMRNSLLLWGAAGLLAITIALVSGLFFARQITRPLSSAANAAAAFGRSESFPLTGSRLKEADEFLVMLKNAKDAREKLIEEVKQSRDWLQTTLNSIGDAVITTDAGAKVSSLNAVAESLTGWKPDEAVGKPLEEIFVIRNAHTGLVVENPVTKVLREGRIVGLANHTRLIGRDGRQIPIDDSAAPIRDGGQVAGVVLVFRDITERLKAEERMRLTVEAAPNAMIMVSREGRIELVNSQTEKLFGYSREELLGQSVEILVPKQYRTGHGALRASFLRQPLARPMGAGRDLFGVRKDGTEVPIEIGLNPISTSQGDFVLAAIIDISERKRADDELHASNAALSRANEDLNQFAFAASHDLQEPLRMVTSYSQLLLKGYRGQLDGEAETCIRFITDGTKRMRELLADLLAYTQVTGVSHEAEDVQEMMTIDLNRVFQTTLENCKTTIGEASATITSDPLPAVKGHEPHFVQLFQNLITNGMKYRSDLQPRIHVSAERQNGLWRIAVKDNGMGIAPEYHKQIFGVFKRLHGKSIPGTGIGLAICQRVIERYHGQIWVESHPGDGATFYFTLPAEAHGAAAHDG